MTIDKQLPSTRTAELDSICLKAEVIPVITIERLEDAVPLGRACVKRCPVPALAWARY